MKYLYLVLILFSSIFLLYASSGLDDCRSACDRDRSCLTHCPSPTMPETQLPSTENQSTENTPQIYPIELEISHTFPSSSSGNMYMALISPFGEIINDEADSIGMIAQDAFEENNVYTNLSMDVISECSYGPGDYNLLVHTNPVGSGTSSFTAESNLYSCQTIFSLLNSIRLPSSWEETDPIDVYCSIFNEASSDLFAVLDGLSMFDETYSGCIIRNINKNSTILAGMLYGSPVEERYDSYTLDTVEEVQTFLHPNASCEVDVDNYSCLIQSKIYEFTYDSSAKVFVLTDGSLSELTQSLDSLIHYQNNVENSLTQSFLIRTFDDSKMLIGYDIPKDFLRENPSLSLDAINRDSSFNFDLSYIIYYHNFGDISSSCYDLLRGQSQSTKDSQRIFTVPADQTRVYFNSTYSIVCHKQFVFLNRDDIVTKTLYKNLIFDTVMGNTAQDIEYESIFDSNDGSSSNNDDNDYFDIGQPPGPGRGSEFLFNLR